jgi:hypothetical protein
LIKTINDLLIIKMLTDDDNKLNFDIMPINKREWLTDDSRPGKKRKRVLNQLRDGIISPPQQINNIKVISGNINFLCPGYTDKSKDYSVEIFNNNGSIGFKCECKGSCGTDVTKACKHINTILLKICSDYIDSAAKFEANKMNYENIKDDLKNVLDGLDKMKLD